MVGFALTMVFAHAPTVLIAVTRVRLTYHPSLYVHVLLVQVGLVVRIVGDALDDTSMLRTGSILIMIGSVAFVLSTIARIVAALQVTHRLQA